MPTPPEFLGGSNASPDSSVDKESACNAGDPSSIPGSGRSPGEGLGYPLRYSWASFVAQLIKNLPPMRETWVQCLVGKIPWRRERLPTPVFWPGEFHGLHSPWGHKGSDTTEWLLPSLAFQREMCFLPITLTTGLPILCASSFRVNVS